jgi:hypothetical protein
MSLLEHFRRKEPDPNMIVIVAFLGLIFAIIGVLQIGVGLFYGEQNWKGWLLFLLATATFVGVISDSLRPLLRLSWLIALLVVFVAFLGVLILEAGAGLKFPVGDKDLIEVLMGALMPCLVISLITGYATDKNKL